MFCGIQFLLGHNGVMSMLLFWGVHYGAFTGQAAEVLSNKGFGWLQSFDNHWKDIRAGLGLLLVFVFDLVFFIPI